MRKSLLIPILFSFCLAGCGKEKSHVYVNADQCSLTLNPIGYGYYFSGNLINDSKRDASNIIMEVYFTNVYREEYQIPAIYTCEYLAKNSQEYFKFRVDYSAVVSWRIHLNWTNA